MAASFTKSAWFQGLAVWVGVAYIRLCHATGRWEHVNEEMPRAFWDSGKPFIVAFWHGRILMIRYGWRTDQPISILISRHGDGELIARVMEKMGIGSVRGSSQAENKKRKDRGGLAALRAMTAALKENQYIGFTPDGPKGPRMRAKEGLVALAKMSGVPIIAGTYSVAPRKVLKSWDGFVLARPFSRGVFIWGNPIEVPSNADDELLEEKRLEIEREMNRITDEADVMMGNTPVAPAKARFKAAAKPARDGGDDVSTPA